MSTSRLEVIATKNGPRFDPEWIKRIWGLTPGNYNEMVSPRHMMTNGWDCHITRSGEIRCECAREYSDGMHVMLYTINKEGFARLTLDTPADEKPRTLKKGYVVSKGMPVAGTLGVAGGYVDCRYAYFREASFDSLLKKAGVTAVEHADPNREYSGHSARCGWGHASFSIETDGEIVKDEFDEPTSYREAFNAPGANPNLYDGYDRIVVEGATWVVAHSKEHYLDNHNSADILYTKEKDVRSILKSIIARKENED